MNVYDVRPMDLHSKTEMCQDKCIEVVTLEAARRECGMRADDNLKLCKEIDALNATIQRVREWLECSPMSERISGRRCRELLAICGETTGQERSNG